MSMSHSKPELNWQGRGADGPSRELPDESQVTAIVCGLATVDILTYPVPLQEPIGAGVLRPVERVELNTGGFVSNAAVGLAKLGIATAAIADVGSDSWGEYWWQSLQRQGVLGAPICAATGGTPVSNVLVAPDSARSFLFAAGVAEHATASRWREQLPRFPRARVVMGGYYSLFPTVDEQWAEFFQAARQRGCDTLLDSAGSGGGADPLRAILPELTVYIPSWSEAEAQTGEREPREIIACLRDWGATGVVGVKLGAAGAVISPQPGEFLTVAARTPPRPVVDTTGAGDAFLAGLMAARLRGEPWSQAVRVAAAAGAWCVTALGATAGLQDAALTWELAGLPPPT